MEFLDTLLGAALTFVGVASGVLLEKHRGARKHREPKKIEPVCGCKHHRSFHKDGKGKCASWDSWNHMYCRCQGYNGPLTYAEVMDQEFETEFEDKA